MMLGAVGEGLIRVVLRESAGVGERGLLCISSRSRDSAEQGR